jgi:hypothetical protein
MSWIKKLFGLEDPEDDRDYLAQVHEFGVELAMIDQGWTPFHPLATPAERQAAYDAIARGERVEWYPPGFADDIVTEGKLRP